MKLIMADIKTNEGINSVEIERVLNIAVFPGKKKNELLKRRKLLCYGIQNIN